MKKTAILWQRSFSSGKIIKGIGLKMLVVGLLLAAGKQALAQGGSWSAPVMISTNTTNSWFSDVVVDDYGQPYVVYYSGRGMDLLMYSTLTDQGWFEPNDIAVTARGGYTVRPAIAVDVHQAGVGVREVKGRGATEALRPVRPSLTGYASDIRQDAFR